LLSNSTGGAAAHLAIHLSEQSLHRNVAVDALLAQGLDHGPDDPPQLEEGLRPRIRLEPCGDLAQGLEALLDLVAADPAEQRQLEAGSQAAAEVGGRFQRPAVGRRARGLVRAQVEQQQGALGEQRPAADGAQVVEQRQQRQRHVATAGRHAIDVGRQLLHCTHQGVEAVVIQLPGARVRIHVARDLFHLLGEQCAPVDLREPQCPACQVDVAREPVQCNPVFRVLGECLERSPGLVQLDGDLAHHQLQRRAGVLGTCD
jgi:hypothetical protein